MGLMDMLKTSDPMAKFYAAAEKSNVPQGGITGKLFSAMFPHGLGNLAFGREPEPMPPLETPEGTALMADLASNMMVPGTTSPRALAKMFSGDARPRAAGLLNNPIAEEAMKIYKNKMGIPDPNATLSPYGGRKIVLSDGSEMYGVPEYFAISAASDLSRAKFDTGIKNGMSLEEVKKAIGNIRNSAMKWAEENDFAIIKDGSDGYGHPSMQFEHVPSKNELDDLIRRSDEKWANSEDVFIRYGDIPAGGRSKNHASDFFEDGVSVYRGKIKNDTGEWKISPSSPAELWGSSSISKRPAFIVEGELIGTGSDGEPLLRNAKIIKALSRNK